MRLSRVRVFHCTGFGAIPSCWVELRDDLIKFLYSSFFAFKAALSNVICSPVCFGACFRKFLPDKLVLLEHAFVLKIALSVHTCSSITDVVHVP